MIKLLRGRGRELHWMLYLTCVAFVVYFCLPLIEGAVRYGGRHYRSVSPRYPDPIY